MEKKIIIWTKTGLVITLLCDGYETKRYDEMTCIFLYNVKNDSVGSFYDIQGWYEETGVSDISLDKSA